MPESPQGDEQPGDDAGLEALLEHLKEARAFDFTGYKRPTLARRIEKRMQQVEVERHEAYIDYLQVHPEEFEQLFNTILINVTGFFRDPDMWEALRQQVVPDLLGRDEIRVWSAGSASGQEAYSAVMLLAEALGLEDAKERVKVYATDVDNEALEQARHATYSGRELEGLPDGYLERYFEPAPRGQVFRRDLRRTVIFGRHDLLVDAPISRVDLLLCRNTLMYFNTDVQRTLVSRLHYALRDDGYLALGKVEMLLGHHDLFEPLDMKQRIFRRTTTRLPMRSRLLAMSGVRGGDDQPDALDPLLEASFEHRTRPELVLDADGTLVAANVPARSLFGIPDEGMGRPFQDLELSYRPVELRSWIDQAVDERRPVVLRDIERWTPQGDQTFLEIELVPLSSGDEHLGVLLTFTDVTPHRHVQDELEQTHRELETAYEELQSSNEELETTNEELQSTIEELETTNEELQSTNEELETMNEELASTNEELQAINDELRDRTIELDQVTASGKSILASIQASVVVVDTDLRVRVWNERSFDLWGLRADEVVGRDLAGLDTGFPFASMLDDLRACMKGDECGVHQVEARTRRGVRSLMRVQVAPLHGTSAAAEGAILVIEEGDALLNVSLVPTVERPAMSGYGVPDDPAGALPWSWAEERLVANKSYWVVTASASGRPHAMPVWGAWMAGTERFWFSCSPSARKARNIAANPQCVVTVDDTVECVSVEGRARLVDPTAEADVGAVDDVVAAYVSKYWDDPAVHPEMEAFVRGHAIVEVTPEVAFGIIEREEEFAQRATRWRW